MKIVDGGTFTVAPGEIINVTVQKSAAPYQASVSDLIGAAWAPKPAPNGLVARGSFTSPAAAQSTVSMAIDCDFIPDATGSFPPGDRYDITIQGNPAEDTRSSTVFAPGLQSRAFLFRVAGGI